MIQLVESNTWQSLAAFLPIPLTEKGPGSVAKKAAEFAKES